MIPDRDQGGGCIPLLFVWRAKQLQGIQIPFGFGKPVWGIGCFTLARGKRLESRREQFQHLPHPFVIVDGHRFFIVLRDTANNSISLLFKILLFNLFCCFLILAAYKSFVAINQSGYWRKPA